MLEVFSARFLPSFIQFEKHDMRSVQIRCYLPTISPKTRLAGEGACVIRTWIVFTPNQDSSQFLNTVKVYISFFKKNLKIKVKIK